MVSQNRAISWLQGTMTLTAAMSQIAAIAIAAAIGVASVAAAQTTASQSGSKKSSGPVTLYVNANDAEVRSGPSEDYYPTMTLDRAESVEVYHKTKDGWLAIRPPQGSFSWIEAKHAYLLPGGKIIEVTNNKAVSWIGTSLGAAKKFRWQVELEKGEQLAVTGERVIQNENGDSALWYQIDPPAGEFRWIHESQVDRKRTTPTRISSNDAETAKPLAEASAGASVVKRGKADDESEIQTAAYQQSILEDDVFADGSSGTLPAPSSSSPVVIESGPPVASGRVDTASGDPWSGWHAIEFGDHGLQLNFLQRMMGGGAPAPRRDPLQEDPFDISMARKRSTSAAPRPQPRQFAMSQEPMPYESHRQYGTRQQAGPGPTYARRERGWRDPRTLRSQYGPSPTAAPIESSNREYASNQDLPPAERAVAGIRQGVDAIRGGLFASKDADIPSKREQSYATPNDDQPSYIGGGSAGDGMAQDNINWYGIGSSSNTGNSPTPVSPGISDVSRASHSVAPSAMALADLQFQLSEMVTQPAASWNLQPMIERAQYLIENGASPLERGQARLLLDRMREFEQHARKTAFIPGMRLSQNDQTHRPTGQLASQRQPFGGSSAGAVGSGVTTAGFQRPIHAAGGTEVRTASGTSLGPTPQLARNQPYDASGWLVPVHSTTEGQPPFALTNDAGEIIAYVSSLPGMRLDESVNRPVGIIGLRGYLPQLQAPLIQAQRIIELR